MKKKFISHKHLTSIKEIAMDAVQVSGEMQDTRISKNNNDVKVIYYVFYKLLCLWSGHAFWQRNVTWDKKLWEKEFGYGKLKQN